jgi:hypothetical protein
MYDYVSHVLYSRQVFQVKRCMYAYVCLLHVLYLSLSGFITLIRVQIMKLLSMQFFFHPLRINCPLRHPVLKHLPSMFFLKVRD